MVPPDDDLLIRARAGDREAFAQIVREHFRVAFSTAMSIVQDPVDAEDVVQDSFVRCWQRLGQCRDASAFRGWLRSVVRSVAYNHHDRERVRRSEPIPDTMAGTESPVTDLERSVLRDQLSEAMRVLTPVQAEVLLLSDLEGFRHAEIAELLGVSELMSRRHLSNARQRMRGALGAPETRRVKQ